MRHEHRQSTGFSILILLPSAVFASGLSRVAYFPFYSFFLVLHMIPPFKTPKRYCPSFIRTPKVDKKGGLFVFSYFLLFSALFSCFQLLPAVSCCCQVFLAVMCLVSFAFSCFFSVSSCFFALSTFGLLMNPHILFSFSPRADSARWQCCYFASSFSRQWQNENAPSLFSVNNVLFPLLIMLIFFLSSLFFHCIFRPTFGGKHLPAPAHGVRGDAAKCHARDMKKMGERRRQREENAKCTCPDRDKVA